MLPAYPGSDVMLHRKKRGKWNEVRSDTLDAESRFALKTKKKCGLYKIVWSEEGAPNEPAKKRVRL